jgi:hypothetical protein
MQTIGSLASAAAGKRTRSPAYPYVNLEEALDRAEEFYGHEGRNAANINVAGKHWGFTENSSSGSQTVAALISYGLMADEGTGEKRAVRLTNNALRILLDTRTDSTERDELIKQAALAPKIHRQIWDKWETIPSDASLRHILLFDWETPFNENSVDYFIKEFRHTIAFAKLEKPDKVYSAEVIKESGEGENSVKEGVAAQGQQQTEASRKIVTPPPKTGMDEFVVPLSDGRAVFQWPKALTQGDIEDLKDSLKMIERKITRLAQEATKAAQ